MTQRRSIRRVPLAAALAFAATQAQAATIVVDSNDDDAATTLCNLRAALTAMNNGALTPHCANASADPFGTNDTIDFAPGLANATITLTQHELPVTPGTNVTINGSGQLLDAQYNSSVLSLNNSTLTGSNLTLAHGHALYGGSGGGIYAAFSSLVLDHCVVSGNQSTGILAYNSNLTLDHCVIEHNSGYGGGGGLSLVGSVATLTNSLVASNSDSVAGGAFASKSTLNLMASTVSGNQASRTTPLPFVSGLAGGLYDYKSTISLRDSTISGNSATGSYTLVGGIYSWDGTLLLINSTVSGNTATGYVSAYKASPVIAGGVSETHETGTAGAGLTLTNTTLSLNLASDPGGVSSYLCGGILLGFGKGTPTAKMMLSNAIVAHNLTDVATTIAPADVAVAASSVAPTTSASHRLLGAALAAGYAGNGNVFGDTPRLAPLRDYGGPTQTMPLLAGSPAIDAGDNALAVDGSSQALTTDQTGAARIVNATVDIGAVEYTGDEIFAQGFEF